MAEMSHQAEEIRKRMDRKETAREQALKETREIIRECRSAISSIQAGKDPKAHIESADSGYKKLKKALSEYPDLRHMGYFLDAEQELVEAHILLALIEEGDLPTPEGLDVTDEAYIMGMADSIGEMRRRFLNRVMADDIANAGSILKDMEEYFDILMTFDYPDALLPVKRKQDVARSIVEKSRGEFVLAMQMSRLRSDMRSGKD